MPAQACHVCEIQRYINLEVSCLICLNQILPLGLGWWIEPFVLVDVLLLIFLLSCFVHFQEVLDDC